MLIRNSITDQQQGGLGKRRFTKWGNYIWEVSQENFRVTGM